MGAVRGRRELSDRLVDDVSSAIDGYRNELAALLKQRTWEYEASADEAADHLREARDELIQLGWSVDAATARAIERFGQPAALAEQFPRTWLPTAHELGWLLATVMCAFGAAGLIAATVRNIAGGTPAVADADGAVAARNLIRMTVGLGGLALGEILSVRRHGRRAFPGSRVVRIGSRLLFGWAAVLCGFTVLALTRAGLTMPWRWASLAICALFAALVYRHHTHPVRHRAHRARTA